MLEREDAITNEVLEAITFLLAYSTVFCLLLLILLLLLNLQRIQLYFNRYQCC